MFALTRGRKFQLWEYHVSHGSLLIRSPAAPGIEKSIDILCVGVEYIAAPRHLGEITILEGDSSEIKRLEEVLRTELPPSQVWAFQGLHERFLLVAAALKVQEHLGDIFDSPFER